MLKQFLNFSRSEKRPAKSLLISLCSVIFLNLIYGCTSQVTSIPLEVYKPTPNTTFIHIYSKSEDVPPNSKIIGSVSLADFGFSTICSYNDMVATFVREARQMGGLAIKITSINHSKYHSDCFCGTANVLRFETKKETKSVTSISKQPKAKQTVYVAIVETHSNGVIKSNEGQYLTDVLREEAISILPSDQNYVIMTRENIQSMLPPNIKIEECEGSCLVETGRNIAADYIAQARINTFGSKLTITVELYNSTNGKLISSFNAKSTDIESLESEIRKKSPTIFKEVLRIESAN